MTTYPGLPGPDISEHVTRAEAAQRLGSGVSFTIGRVCMVTNTGTYMDVPYHFYADGDQLSDVALHRVAELEGVVIDAPAVGRAIGADAFDGVDVRGRAVLVRTGWDQHFGTDAYGIDAPFLSAAAVELLVSRGAALVGIDSVNIDDMGDTTRPAHCGLLGAGIPIVEHLTELAALPRSGFRFSAVPPKFAGLGTFPVRAMARLG